MLRHCKRISVFSNKHHQDFIKRPLTVIALVVLFAATFFPIAGYAGDPKSGMDVIGGGRSLRTPTEEEATVTFTPYLTINGDTLLPVAADSVDLLLKAKVDEQTWTLLRESTAAANTNRFGYYTDPGTGDSQILVFAGPDGKGASVVTHLAPGTPFGLWLLNDSAGNTQYSPGDPYPFSERFLSRGLDLRRHQCFQVYDLSRYRGTAGPYVFKTFTSTDTISGEFDYLIFADDGSISSAFDHNDMVVGLTSPAWPPVVNCAPPTTVLACSQGEVCIPGFTYSDYDKNIASVVVIGGTLHGDTVCFTPSGEISHTITLIVTDSTGKADTCSTTVGVTMNTAPICQVPNDTTIFQCYPQEICLPLFSYDPDGNYAGCEVVSGPGSIGLKRGDLTERPGHVGATNASPLPEWCYMPTVDSSFDVVIRCSDTCGAFCQDTFHVAIQLNHPPVCHVPSDTTIILCSLDPVCLPVYCTDQDNNLLPTAPLLLTPQGTVANGKWCYTPTGDESVFVAVRCEDSCGAICEKSFTVTFKLNRQAPVCSAPADTTIRQCMPAQACLPVGCTDPDGNLLPNQPTILSGKGTITNGHWCYTPTGSEVVPVTIQCADACGLTCQKTFTVAFHVNTAPVCQVPKDTTIFQCTLAGICLPVGCSDIDGNLLSGQPTLVSGKGAISNGQWCYTPTVSEDLTVTTKCEDSCGATCTTSFNVHIKINRAPVCTPPADQTIMLCASQQVCLPIACSDPDGNLLPNDPIILSGPGTIVNHTWCYTSTGNDTAVVTMRCEDSCGAFCESTFKIIFKLNRPPVCSVPKDTSIFLCDFSEICLPVGCSDPDGNALPGQPTLVGSPGAIKNGSWCYTPTNQTESFDVAVQCQDSCAAVCSKSFHVSIRVDRKPGFSNLPANLSVFMCEPLKYCYDIKATDPDGDPVIYSLVSGKGTIDSTTGRWCFTPAGDEIVNVTVRVRDIYCAGYTQANLQVNFKFNKPPVAVAPPDTTVVSCNLFSICLPGFSYSDPDNNLQSVIATGGSLSGDKMCFNPVLGVNTLSLIVTDSCGKADTAFTHVLVTDSSCAPKCPNVKIAKLEKVIQGMMTCVPITMEGHSFTMGGFDMLISYDYSALSLSSVTQGGLLTDCRWEYFTYRFGPFGNCGSGCPSGLVKVVAIAETNNGTSHPTCYGPTGSAPVELAELCFLVSNDRRLECQYVPIRFFWSDCSDNTFANKRGDTSFVSNDVFDFNNPNSIADLHAGFPTWFGVQSECLVGGGTPDKPAPVRCVDFYNGGIDIICADSIDSRGDINLNGLAYEVSDAVMFTNYFVKGLSAFQGHTDGSIAASDVNADGVPLTVADLVYLIRVIIGDAFPTPKLAPVDMTLSQSGGALSVSGDVGAALVLFRGDVQPKLLAGQMEMIYSFDGTATRALVYSLKRDAKFSGAFIEAPADVIAVEMATYEGTPINAKLTPDHFALQQNYPNPFNPSTTIEFSVPAATDYTVTIYNITGQQVALLAGHAEPGHVTVTWDASNLASGMYLYRLDAGAFSQTRKMVLLK